GSGNSTEIIHDLKGNFYHNQDFNLVSSKTLAPMGKHMHTNTKFFKYMQVIMTRPVIEVSFRELTLTLKGTNKYLMRCVTGKIRPGRVSALWDAKKTGLILINGKNVSIHSYRKIIGLSADMPKADKVLIIERVIDSLGLQHVRDSLVGTVENREFQVKRKRVNVGMEMVMEPSLLILDEPTSGLDSSSFQLLLEHLAERLLKGMSREYFAGLGVIVPDRVNPPDYLIDLLEGVVPSTSIDMKQLPLRWMLHNGYPIPRICNSMLQRSHLHQRGLDTSTETECNADVDGIEVRSFAGDLWEDVKLNAEIQQDNFHHNFLMLKDLYNRSNSWCIGNNTNTKLEGKVSKQRLRESKIQAVDFMILFLAGACLGLLDKLIYWRESSSGMSSFAYFLSKDTVDHFNTLVKPVVYLSMFYFFSNPRSSFMDYYIVLVFLVYCVTGVAYAFSIFLEPGAAQLWSVLLPVVLTLVLTQQYSGVWLITRCVLELLYCCSFRCWQSHFGLFVNGDFPKEINYTCHSLSIFSSYKENEREDGL
ncbi:hypothetical protein MKW92_014728, partial [Papaver armeniacum]